MAEHIDAWKPVKYQTSNTLAIWPIGEAKVATKGLRWVLASSAQWHSQTSIRRFNSTDKNELLQAAISVGTASELLLKTLVCTTSPTLLAARDARNSLLILAGASRAGEFDLGALDFQSILGPEVLELARKLYSTSGFVPPKKLMSLAVRNAASHLGIVDSNKLKEAINEHCRLVEDVLRLLDLDTEAYWGEELYPIFRSLVDTARSDAERQLCAKIESARAVYGELYGMLPEAILPPYFAGVVQGTGALGDGQRPQECPACLQQGWLVYAVDDESVFVDPDDGTTWTKRTASLQSFECPICKLRLEYEELKQILSDSPDDIELEPRELSDEDLRTYEKF